MAKSPIDCSWVRRARWGTVGALSVTQSAFCSRTRKAVANLDMIE